MTNNPHSLSDKLARIDKAIDAQESLRGLGLESDEEIDKKLHQLRQQRSKLATQLPADSARTVRHSHAGANIITGDNNRLITNIIHLYRQGKPQETDESTLRRQIAGYLRGLVNRYSRLELRGIKRKGEQVIQLDLEQVYVPLAGRAYRHNQPREIELNQVLGQGRHVVITGAPGCGKTTVLLHLISTLALALGSNAPDVAQDKLGLAANLPLPILIPLSSYARYRRELPPGSAPEAGTLAAFISHYLIRRQHGSFDLPRDFFQQLLRTGQQVIVLLDGLDEVPDENERVEVREAIEGLLDGSPNLQVVVTCRSAAFKGRAVLGRDFKEVTVLPLTADYISRLVNQAYAVPGLFDDEPGLAGRKAAELLQAIDNLENQRRRMYGRHTEPLITSPLLVRMLIIVHVSDRRLPDQRAELYKKATDNLLLPEFHPDQEVANEIGGLVGGSQNIHREMAQHLAFEMHQRGPKQGREVDEFELKAILKKHPIHAHLTTDFIKLARSRNTLVQEKDGQYSFIHLAFQEFLVASYLADVTGGEAGYGGIAGFLEQGPVLDSWWREPILLIAGYYSIDKPAAAQKFLRRLAGLDGDASTPAPDAKIRLAATELAGSAALEWPGVPAGLKDTLARQLAKLFDPPNLPDQIPPPLRVSAGNTLAYLNDPRPGVLEVDTIEFCYVPPGPFMMGSSDDDKQARDNEKPQRRVNLDYGFWLARFPVTVAQWQKFVTEANHKPDSGNSLRGLPNHPVTSVTWFEAIKFCAWLTGRWRGAGLLPDGWQVTLPSEAEWEKAARGGVRLPPQAIIRQVSNLDVQTLDSVPGPKNNPILTRRYPWGNSPNPERANYEDTGIGSTSPVGIFPQGASPAGALDMAGNVWEWTRTIYKRYPYDPDDGRERLETETDIQRVLRGGSFSDTTQYVRCAVRVRIDPGLRLRDYGFRVALSPFFLPLHAENSGL